MEKDLGKLNKNDRTDIVLRVDDFGGKRGLTIREYVTSEKYTGFTKAGVRITPENFPKFKEMVNSISEEELNQPAEESGASPGSGQGSQGGSQQSSQTGQGQSQDSGQSKSQEQLPDY